MGFGIDDVTLGFDMTGSKSIRRLNSMPGIDTRWGKRLGERGSWGAWVNAFGRSAAHWKPETCRLYVQAKLSAEGTLCAPGEFTQACHALFERMALVGVTSFEPVWVTRLDVAVDAHCEPAAGKLLLDALEAAQTAERLADQLGRQPALDRLLQGSGEREGEGTSVLPQSQAQAGRTLWADSA